MISGPHRARQGVLQLLIDRDLVVPAQTNGSITLGQWFNWGCPIRVRDLLQSSTVLWPVWFLLNGLHIESMHSWVTLVPHMYLHLPHNGDRFCSVGGKLYCWLLQGLLRKLLLLYLMQHQGDWGTRMYQLPLAPSPHSPLGSPEGAGTTVFHSTDAICNLLSWTFHGSCLHPPSTTTPSAPGHDRMIGRQAAVLKDIWDKWTLFSQLWHTGSLWWQSRSLYPSLPQR